MKKRLLLFTLIMAFTFVFPSFASDIPNFIGSKGQWEYSLSNGQKVRIEYHGGEPHIHEVEEGKSWSQSKNSEKVSSDKVHHDGDKPLTKGTRDKLKKGKKLKSRDDKDARNKVKELEEQWEKHQEAKENSEGAKKSMIERNKDAIADAINSGGVIVVIGGTIYLAWWLAKLASGWGIFLPI